MKTIKVSISSLALASVMILITSCKHPNVDDATVPMNSDMHQETTSGTVIDESATMKTEVVLRDYLNLKDALVDDDNAEARTFAMTLNKSLKAFDASNYSDSERLELNTIIENSVNHTEAIATSDIEQQRKHFKMLSQSMTDMVAITGTENKLYVQYCPMYDGGTAWLSMNEEVRNPYYGSSMLKCGKIEREIN